MDMLQIYQARLFGLRFDGAIGLKFVMDLGFVGDSKRSE